MKIQEIFSAGLKLMGIIALINTITSITVIAGSLGYLQTEAHKYTANMLTFKTVLLVLKPVLYFIVTVICIVWGDNISGFLLKEDIKNQGKHKEMFIFRTILRIVGVYCIILWIPDLLNHVRLIQPGDVSVIEGAIKIDYALIAGLVAPLVLLGLGTYFIFGAKHLVLFLYGAKK